MLDIMRHVKHKWRSRERMTQRIVGASLLFTFLVGVLLVMWTQLPQAAQERRTATYTTTTDFSFWQHTNTLAINNQIELAQQTSPESLIKKKAEVVGTSSHFQPVWYPPHKKFYLLGGFANNPIDQIATYDPASDIFATLPNKLPTRRHSYAAAYSPETEKIYLVGGADTTVAFLDQIIEFDPNTQTSTVLPVRLPYGRENATAVYNPADKLIYIFGGFTSASYTQQTLVFSPQARTLQIKNVASPLTGLPGTAVWNNVTNTIWLIGGSLMSSTGREPYAQVVEYTPTTNTFSQKISTLPNTRGSVVWSNATKSAFILGGYQPSALIDGEPNDYITSIYEYNPSTNQARLRTATFPATQINRPAAVNLETGSISVFGGGSKNPTREIFTYTPSFITYATTGTALLHYAAPATAVTWESARPTLTTPEGTAATVHYTTAQDCQTGLTTEITTLASSNHLCAVVTLTTSNKYVSPALLDLAIDYTFAGTPTATPTILTSSTPTAVPSPSPTISATPQPSPTPFNVTLCLTDLTSNNPHTGNRVLGAMTVNLIPHTAGKPTIAMKASISPERSITLENLPLDLTTHYDAVLIPEGYLSIRVPNVHQGFSSCMAIPQGKVFKMGDVADGNNEIKLNDLAVLISARTTPTTQQLLLDMFPFTNGKPSLSDLAQIIATYKQSPRGEE